MSTYHEAIERGMPSLRSDQVQQNMEPADSGVVLATSFFKDKMYVRIAQLGMELRHLGNDRYRHRYTSNGFTPAIASQLGLSPDIVGLAIRNMRIDSVYQTDDPDFSARFIELAKRHLEVHTEELPPSLRPPTLVSLSKQWDRSSPASFYRDAYGILYPAEAVRAISGLVPWELEAMEELYTRRIREGSQPSPFNIEVLRANSHSKVLELTKAITDATGIPLKDDGISVHRIALEHCNLKIAA